MSRETDYNQIALGLTLQGAATFGDYWPGPNAEVLEHLRQHAIGVGFQTLFLWGPDGTGKTHLLHASCNSGQDRRMAYLPLAEVMRYGPRVLEDLESLDGVCIDDLHLVAGRDPWERALFACFNRLRDAGRRLLVTAPGPPQDLPLIREDLNSRLRWGLVCQLRALSDEDKARVLTFLCEHRGMQISAAVVEYILRRIPRTMARIVDTVEQLDNASLQAQRRLTVPFVKDVLELDE